MIGTPGPKSTARLAYPNGTGGTVPVTNQSGLTGALNTGWAAPLATSYPYRTRLTTQANSNPNSQVLSSGQNQAGDPRADFAGLWKLAFLGDNAGKLGGGAVIGGSNINVGTNGISYPMLIILAGVILLFIWK